MTIAVTDEQRRRRLVARHHLDRTASDVVEAVRGVGLMHSSDPVTPYLGAWARVAGFDVADLEAALHDDRSLWRTHTIRRTLWVVPVEDAGAHARIGREIAARERRRVEGWLADELPSEDVTAWVARLEAAVLEVLDDGGEHRTQDLTAAVPASATEITLGSGRWSIRSPVGPRLLYLMAMEGRIVRTRPAGSWRSSQYRWASAARWFGAPLEPADPDEARAALVGRYLERFGPVTETDVRWWTGFTAAQTRRALGDLGAVEVVCDDGGGAYVAPDDLEQVDGASAPTVALLPGLDPTAMGWKQRDWYLGAHTEHVFDTNGNAGPTVWVDGRVVGGWSQDADGRVLVGLLEEVGADAGDAVDAEAAALTAWLDGVVAVPRFRTPLERELSG